MATAGESSAIAATSRFCRSLDWAWRYPFIVETAPKMKQQPSSFTDGKKKTYRFTENGAAGGFPLERSLAMTIMAVGSYPLLGTKHSLDILLGVH